MQKRDISRLIEKLRRIRNITPSRTIGTIKKRRYLLNWADPLGK